MSNRSKEVSYPDIERIEPDLWWVHIPIGDDSRSGNGPAHDGGTIELYLPSEWVRDWGTVFLGGHRGLENVGFDDDRDEHHYPDVERMDDGLYWVFIPVGPCTEDSEGRGPTHEGGTINLTLSESQLNEWGNRFIEAVNVDD